MLIIAKRWEICSYSYTLIRNYMESPSAPLDLILDNTLKGQIQGH